MKAALKTRKKEEGGKDALGGQEARFVKEQEAIESCHHGQCVSLAVVCMYVEPKAYVGRSNSHEAGWIEERE